MITRWIVDVYHVRLHRGLNDSPIRVYQRSVERYGRKPLPDPDRLTAMLSLSYFRKVHPKGIVFEDLWYDSERLRVYSTLPKVSRILSIKVDPNDLSHIWFFDEQLNDYVECRIQRGMRERIQGITLAAHKMARALQRSNPEILAGEAGLSKAYSLIRRSLEEDVRGRDGLTNRRRAMRKLDKLRQRAKASFEDASAFDRREDNLVDDLFGPEEQEPTHAEENGEAAVIDVEEVELSTTKRRAKGARKTQSKPSQAKSSIAKPQLPAAEQDENDDLSNFDRAVSNNLFMNDGQEDPNV